MERIHKRKHGTNECEMCAGTLLTRTTPASNTVKTGVNGAEGHEKKQSGGTEKKNFQNFIFFL